MSVTTLTGDAEVAATLAVIGGTSIGQNRNDLLKQVLVAVANGSGGGGGGGTWGSITGTLSNQTDLQTALNAKQAAFTNGTGVLTNDGAGNWTYTAKSLGGNGVADSGKLAVFGASGQLAAAYIETASGGETAVMSPNGFTFGLGADELLIELPTLSGVSTITFPNITGTLVTTGDTGTVTNGMLAGSIAPSKITGTAALLGANTFTALQQFSGTTHAGIRLNNLTTAQRDAIGSPAAGMTVWNTTATRMNLYNGSAWTDGFVRLAGDSMTGALTITAATGTTALTLASGTQTASFPLLIGTQTWNNAGVTFVGELQNYTSTASAAASRFLEYQLAGVAKFAVRKDGALGVGGLPTASGIFTIINGSSITTLQQDSGYISFNVGADILTMQGDCRLASGIPLSWCAAGSAAGAKDLFIGRKAAATLRLGVDAAGVTDQMLTAASRITSDGVGANFTIAPGNGRGAAGGALILSTYDTGAAATIGTLRSRMTFDTAGAVAFPVVTAVTTETVVSDTTWPVTINGVAYKICLKA